MSDMSLIEMVVFVYMFLVIAKTILCYATLPIALGTIYRTKGRGFCVLSFVILLVGIPVACLLSLPYLLRKERLMFFVMYSRFHTIRSVRW